MSHSFHLEERLIHELLLDEMLGKASNRASMRKCPGVNTDNSVGSVDKGIRVQEFICFNQAQGSGEFHGCHAVPWHDLLDALCLVLWMTPIVLQSLDRKEL